MIDADGKTTVRDELQDVAQDAITFIKEALRTKKVQNEKVEAETVLILEKARDIYERRQSELADARIDREAKSLENFLRKIEISEKLWEMYNKLEPNSVVGLIGEYGDSRVVPDQPPAGHKLK